MSIFSSQNQDLSSSEYLPVDHSKMLKGILAICVLIHHLYQYSRLMNGTIIGLALQGLGYWAVACFFFLSGYGLSVSYKRKGRRYIKNLPKERILPLFILYSLLTMIYILEKKILMGGNFNSLLNSFVFGSTEIVNGWYLQVLILFYVIYWLINTIDNNSTADYIVLLFSLFYSLLCSLIGLSYSWYVTSIAFPVGILSVHYRWEWKITSKNVINVFASIFVWFLSYYAISLTSNSFFKAMLYSISSISFCFFVIPLVSLIKHRNSFLAFFGEISFEIYVLQGLFLSYFKYIGLDNNQPILFVITVAGLTIISAVICHPFVIWIFRLFRRDN